MGALNVQTQGAAANLTKHDRLNCPKVMPGCRSCSGRLFHSVGPAVAKQRSSNWLRDLLTKHVRLSADCRGPDEDDVL